METTHTATPLDVRHVVVPLDGSSLAAAALPTAEAVASRLGAELSTITVARGDPAAAITQHAQSREGALIVMSTRGRGRFSGLLGSVAGDVLASTGAPVLAVGPRADRPGWLVGRPRRRPKEWAEPLAVGDVVALVDGTAESEAAVPVAARWAAALDRALVVLTVAEDAPARLDGTRPNRFGHPEPQVYVDAAAERAREIAPVVRGEVFFDPIGVASGVRSYLGANEAALVVLASARRTGVDRVRRGATAADVVRVSPVPALLVPPANSEVVVPAGRRQDAGRENAAVRLGGSPLDESSIDDVLDDSFPASDPPSWWAGAARV